MSDDTSPLPPDAYDFASVAPLPLQFAFRVRIYFTERLRFMPTTPNGGRVYVPPAGGDISGPRLQGRVVPNSGADWARGRVGFGAVLNAHYMLEAADGTPIYLHNRGYLYGRDDGGNALPPVEREGSRTDVAGGTTPWQIADDTYFVCTPEFDCPVGPHDWLTRLVIVGRGRRIPSPDHTVFDYFVVNPPKSWR
jgi:hypothetical protein